MVQVCRRNTLLRDLRLGLFLCPIAAVSLTAAQSVADGAAAQKCVWRFLEIMPAASEKVAPTISPTATFEVLPQLL
jgi:hypothetical protein